MNWKALVLFSLLPMAAMAQVNKGTTVKSWQTTADRTRLLTQMPDELVFSNRQSNAASTIIVDDRQQFQTIDGFGYAITGGTAELMMKMTAAARAALIKELFTSGEKGGAGISYLRITVGASDLNSFVFSYNDLPNGETDYDLKKFNLSQDLKDVIPVMKEILSVQPNIKIMASPWSAPAWMKTNNTIRGGALKKECYDVYARYLVRYLQEMKKQGIGIDALTIQNEPLNSRNTPSMQWLREEQAEFLRDHLAPHFRKNNINTKVVLFDHNCDRIDYPLALLNDSTLSQFVDGSGFHHYGGDLGAMTYLHTARPDKNIYFTEQMIIERNTETNLNISTAVKRMLVGTMRNWSKNCILWNLAADPLNDPHTDNGGCGICQGALTLDKDKVSKNLAYYTIAHASQFVPDGSVRIASTAPGDKAVVLTQDEERSVVHRATVIESAGVLPNVAFKTPQGTIVLIVVNDTYQSGGFTMQYRGKSLQVKLAPGAVGTYVWRAD